MEYWSQMSRPYSVLFLCTGNSCRSIKAEALLNQLGAGHFKASSAGSFPTGQIHPESILTLKRHRIDPGAPYSKSLKEFSSENFDLVVTVCDQAAGEACPIFIEQVKNCIGTYQILQKPQVPKMISVKPLSWHF